MQRLILDLTRYHAFLFDLDGVVTRTAEVHAAAWTHLFDELLEERYGPDFRRFAREDYLRYVDGKPRSDGVTSFLESRGIELPPGSAQDDEHARTIQGLAQRKDRYFHEVMKRDGVGVFEPTVRLLHDLRARGALTAVVSSSRNCAEVLEVTGLSGLFDVRMDGVERARLRLPGKPAPDTFLEAARQLGVPAGRAVVFEDASAGVAAGRGGRFGLVVGIAELNHASELFFAGADVVVPDVSGYELVGRRRPQADAA